MPVLQESEDGTVHLHAVVDDQGIEVDLGGTTVRIVIDRIPLPKPPTGFPTDPVLQRFAVDSVQGEGASEELTTIEEALATDRRIVLHLRPAHD